VFECEIFFKKGKREDLRKYRLLIFTSAPGKVMEQLILESVSKHMKDKKIWNSQHGFPKGKL